MPKVTQKGQVTIPIHIRKMLKIEIGDEVTFQQDGKKIILIKNKKSSIKNIKNYIGFLSHLQGKDSDDIINELRGTEDDFSS
ncbi:MAG: AbrB/MazE/SpoVT family DNA-binding domain-containing protein [bacterium]